MSDAQYVIDIAARMADGGQTVAQLDQITAGLLSAGKNADFFSDAMTTVSSDLAAAKAQATAANEALAASNAEFDRLERAANQAAIALERAGKQAKGAVPIEVKRNADAASAALAAHKSALAAVESNAARANAREKELAATLGNLKTLAGHANKTLAEQAERLGKLQQGVSSLGGPIGGIAGRLIGMAKGATELGGAIGASSAAAVVATTVFAALTAVVIAGGIALASYGIGQADARRNTELATEAMKAQHPILVGLDDALAGVTRETGIGAAALQKLTLQLEAAKVSADGMPGALRAAALETKALGSADAFVASIREGKTAVEELAASTSAKFGGIVAQQMRGLSAQSQRLQDNLASTFGGLNIEPVLNGMARLVGLFDQETAAGQALKFMFETVFQPLVNGVEGASVAIEAFVLRLMIWGLKGYIALKPFSAAFEALAIGIAAAGAAFVGTLVPAALTALAALGPLIATAAVAAAPFLALAAAVAAVYFAVTNWSGLVDGFTGLIAKMPEIGAAIISGLASALLPGPVIKALTGVVSGAIDSAKSMLGIASPSKVFEGIGANTVMGFTGALEEGQADSAEAGGAMVSPAIGAAAQAASTAATAAPAVAPAAVASPGASPAAAGVTGSGATITINISGVEGAESMISRIREEVTRLLEADALAAGAG